MHSLKPFQKNLHRLGSFRKNSSFSFEEIADPIKSQPSISLSFQSIFPSSWVEEFEFLEKIGEGNQAIVYKIRNRATNCILAAKIYNTTDPEKISQIEREAEILLHIQHKNIIETFKFLEDASEGYFAIIMEYFPSITLSCFINDHALNLEDCVKICQELYKTIEFMHENLITHRDLNLNNVLVNTETFEIKVIDFGLSLKNTDSKADFNYPEGNRSYRPPSLEIFNSSYAGDVWSISLIFLSLFMKTNVTSKMACNLLKNKAEESSFEAKVLRIMGIFFSKTERDPITLIKNYEILMLL